VTPERDPTRRATKARPALVVRPIFVSQETAFAVLGITPRKFRELLVPMCQGFVVRMGKSVLIPADVAEGSLRSLSADAARGEADDSGHDANDEADDDDNLQTADDILHALGRRRAP
jgi:hypothetical protein